jgi:hypothetical protein
MPTWRRSINRPDQLLTGFVSTFDKTVIEPLLAHPRDSQECRLDNAGFDRVEFGVRRAAGGVFPI